MEINTLHSPRNKYTVNASISREQCNPVVNFLDTLEVRSNNALIRITE